MRVFDDAMEEEYDSDSGKVSQAGLADNSKSDGIEIVTSAA